MKFTHLIFFLYELHLIITDDFIMIISGIIRYSLRKSCNKITIWHRLILKILVVKI